MTDIDKATKALEIVRKSIKTQEQRLIEYEQRELVIKRILLSTLEPEEKIAMIHCLVDKDYEPQEVRSNKIADHKESSPIEIDD